MCQLQKGGEPIRNALSAVPLPSASLPMPSAKENARRLLRAHGRWWDSKAGRKSFTFQQKAFG